MRVIQRARRFSGAPKIPGDKSISHRALLLGALAQGTTRITGLLESGDVDSSARCLRRLGVTIFKNAHETVVRGEGLRHFRAPTGPLDCGNSGTTMRTLMGVLAGSTLSATLIGDASLSRRPMKRAADPLKLMGARIALQQGQTAPVRIDGSTLNGIDYELPIASAQLKTALLFAALSAEGETRLRGRIDSRDHTERLLPYFGGDLRISSGQIRMRGGQALQGRYLTIPGDPSTAAFWIAAACLVPGSDIALSNVSLNPTRTGLLRLLERMGANLACSITDSAPEPMGNIRASHGELRAVQVSSEEVPSLIDEIPILAVLATQAKGRTEVRGAEELRVKESDRIEALAMNLRAMGVELEVLPDGFNLEGPQKLKGAPIRTFDDHRIAMAFAIAGLIAEGETTLDHEECVAISYPGFFRTLEELTSPK